MQLAVPVAVKLLHRGNKELSRNLSSYLSLAAINNAEILAEHLSLIIDSGDFRFFFCLNIVKYRNTFLNYK